MLTIRANGTTWLHGLPGAVTGLKFSSALPIGCLTASWTMSLPQGYTHPALRQGALIDIMAGPLVVWSGVLAEPDRTAWEFTADGLGLLVSQGRVAAVDSSNKPTTSISTAATAAAARGWAFTLGASSPGAPLSTDSETSANLNTLGALLDAYCENNAQRWAIGPNRTLRVIADPTTPEFALTPGVPAMATADDDYVSLELVRYVSAVSGTPPEPSAWAVAAAEDPTARDRWGAREEINDQTSLGLLTSGGAAALASAAIASNRARPSFTEGVEVSRYQVTTLGGTSPELWELVRRVPSGIMVRHHGVLTSEGVATLGGTLNWVIGSAEYEAGASTIKLTPVGLAPRTQAAVTAAQAAAVRAAFA